MSVFFDSNVLLYLAGSDAAKAAVAEKALLAGGHISVQVLNEIAHVARRKMRLEWPEIRAFLASLKALLTVHPVTAETHANGLSLAERYKLSVHDGMILSAALLAGCTRLLTEDMHTGMLVQRRLRLVDPFRT